MADVNCFVKSQIVSWFVLVLGHNTRCDQVYLSVDVYSNVQRSDDYLQANQAKAQTGDSYITCLDTFDGQ